MEGRVGLNLMLRSCHMNFDPGGCEGDHGSRLEMLVGDDTLQKMTLHFRLFRKSTIACNEQLKVNWPAPMFAI